MNPGKKPRSAPKAPPAAAPRRNNSPLFLAMISGLLLLALWTSGWLFYHRSQQPKLPLIDLRPVDPKAARVIQKHLEAVRQSPRSAEAWGWLGALLRVYDFNLPARQCLERAETLDPANPRWPYYHGLAVMITEPANAIPKFRRAAELCGVEPEIPRIRLARLLGEQARWDEAEKVLEPLLTAKPGFTPARLLSARAAHFRGDLPRAVELAKACANDPRTARSAWALLAMLYRQQDDTTAAADAAQRSAALPPDQGMGDPFEEEVMSLRGDPRLWSEQAHALLSQNALPEAARLIDRLVLQHPDWPDTWLLLGRLQYLRKDLAAAERALRRHLDQSPQSVQGLFQLGMVLMALNRFPEAAEIFARSTQFKSDFGPGYYNRGFALARSGRPREAIAAFRESLRHNPERADTYFLLADLHLQLGESEPVAKLLDQARALNPADLRLAVFQERLRRSKQEP